MDAERLLQRRGFLDEEDFLDEERLLQRRVFLDEEDLGMTRGSAKERVPG